jgi:hypothetical protein
MKVFVAFSATHFARDLADLTQRNVAEDLRKLHQRGESGDELWRSWAINTRGTLVHVAGGKGLVEVPADKLPELENLKDSYSAVLSSPVAVGVGTTPADADTALRVAENQGGDRIVLYRQGIEKQLGVHKDSEQGFDKVFDRIINDQQEGAEGAPMEKGEQVGFHRPQAVAAPASPVAQTAEHSEAQAALSAINDPERPPAPEQTQAAASLEDQLHSLAGDQQDQDTQTQEAQGKNLDAVKSRLASILEKVRAQAPVLGAMQKQAPETYDAIMNLIQGVIAMGRAISMPPPSDAKPVAKSEPEACAHTTEEPHCGLEKCVGKKELEKDDALPGDGHLKHPVGTKIEGGPTGVGDPHKVGKVKTKHGDGTISDKQMRAGMVSAVADRHAAPVLGSAAHPTSSRTPTAR